MTRVKSHWEDEGTMRTLSLFEKERLTLPKIAEKH